MTADGGIIRDPLYCPTCGCARAGADKDGHLLYGRWLSFRDFEQILLALGGSRSDVRRLWPSGEQVASLKETLALFTVCRHCNGAGCDECVKPCRIDGCDQTVILGGVYCGDHDPATRPLPI